MQWWAWLAVGAILLGAELSFVDAQFYLVFIGAAAITVSFVTLAHPAVAIGLQWFLFSGLVLVAMLGFRRRIYERMRPRLPAMQSGPAGEVVVVPAELAPGAECRLEFRGSSWSAVNAGKLAIGAGCRARIQRVDGLTLVLHADS